MLNRRILRIKAFKVLYASVISGTVDLDEALKILDRSCLETRELYVFMLAIIFPITREAVKRIDAGKAKINPTEEEIHPNEMFANNRVAGLLENDPDFRKAVKKYNISWEPYEFFIMNLFDSVVTKDYYREYMESEKSSLKKDCDLFSQIFEEEFVDRDDIYEILEERSSLCVDDLGYVLSYCCRAMDDLAAGKQWRLPEVYQSEMVKRERPYTEMESDRFFVRRLFAKAFSGYDKYLERISANVPGWDQDRLFSIDIALIVMGLAEVDAFPDIDPKISVNEYVEISKFYSAPKGRIFVNGVLNELVFENDLPVKKGVDEE